MLLPICPISKYLEDHGFEIKSFKFERIPLSMRELSPEEQAVVSQLRLTNDLQLNMLSVKTNLPIGQLNSLLFQLEMKGVVKALAGGVYHLIGL